MAGLTDVLVGRIKARASDPDRRTGASPAASGTTITVGNLSVATVTLNSVLAGNPAPPPPAAPLPMPAGAVELAAAERTLGFPLPPDVRRLYGEVADGGYGPGAGLLSLQEVVRTFQTLTATPPGRRGQTWPTNLLPLAHTDPGYVCVDIGTGAVIFWDEEMLADGASDKVWKRSFKSEAPDIATWFERWLGTRSPEEKMRDMVQNAMRQSLRTSLQHWRSKTPEERAKYGLPETGWEQQLFGHLGIDLTGL